MQLSQQINDVRSYPGRRVPLYLERSKVRPTIASRPSTRWSYFQTKPYTRRTMAFDHLTMVTITMIATVIIIIIIAKNTIAITITEQRQHR